MRRPAPILRRGEGRAEWRSLRPSPTSPLLLPVLAEGRHQLVQSRGTEQSFRTAWRSLNGASLPGAATLAMCQR